MFISDFTGVFKNKPAPRPVLYIPTHSISINHLTNGGCTALAKKDRRSKPNGMAEESPLPLHIDFIRTLINGSDVTITCSIKITVTFLVKVGITFLIIPPITILIIPKIAGSYLTTASTNAVPRYPCRLHCIRLPPCLTVENKCTIPAT